MSIASSGRETCRLTSAGSLEARARHQFQGRQSARPRSPADLALPRRRGDRIDCLPCGDCSQPLLCRFSDAGDDEASQQARKPESEKRQCTKLRGSGHRQCRGLYGDLATPAHRRRYGCRLEGPLQSPLLSANLPRRASGIGALPPPAARLKPSWSVPSLG